MKCILPAILLTIIIGLLSCGKSDVSESTAKIRFFNASAFSGDINVFMDGKKMYATDIIFENYTLFSSHLSNTHEIVVKNAAGTTLHDTTLLMIKGKNYSCFMYDSAGMVKPLWIEEDFTRAIGSFCKLRFIHASNNASPVDILRSGDTTVYFRNFSNGMHSPYTIFDIDSTSFTAIENPGGAFVSTQYRNIGLKAGNFYTLLLTGSTGSTGVDSIGFYLWETTADY